MKTKQIAFLLVVVIFIITGTLKAQTTCDLTLTGADQTGSTYTVSFRVIDTSPSTHWETGWYDAGNVSFGLNDDVYVDLDVDPDSFKRWILAAKVTKTYNGNTYDFWGYSDLLTSDEYYAGDIPVYVHIP